MTSYRFDLYPRTDPRDGTLIRSFTELQKAAYRAEANGTSTGQIAVRSTTDDGQAIDPLGLQYVRVVELPGGSVRGGFFLEKGKFQALSEDEDSLLTFSGAGTLAYLARAAMAPHTYLDIAIGTDPYDDTWRWGDQGPAAGGDFIGAALWRVIYEAQHFRVALTQHRHADGVIYTDSHDDDRTESAIPDVVMTFDQFEDSSGNAWTIPSGDLRSQVGDNVLSVVKRLMEAGLYVELDPDTFELNAWEQDVHRAMLDATGTAWATDVVRFQAPTDPDDITTGNIKDDAIRNIEAHIKRSALWAGGSDIYGLSTSPSDIPWEGFYRADTDDTEALEAIAANQLQAIADAGDTLKLQLWMDDDPANGRYLPFDHVKLDQSVTVHTGTDQWEFDERTFPVAAITVELRQGGNWQGIVELGASYSAIASRSFQVRGAGGHTHPPNPELCRLPTAATTPEVLDAYGLGVSGDSHHLIPSLVPSGAGALVFVAMLDDSTPLTSVKYLPFGTGLDEYPMTFLDSHTIASVDTANSIYAWWLQSPVAGNGNARISWGGGGVGGKGLGAWVTDSTATPTVDFDDGDSDTASITPTAGTADLAMVAAGFRQWSLGDASQTPSALSGQTVDWADAQNNAAGQGDICWGGGHATGGGAQAWDLVDSQEWVAVAISQPGSGGSEGDCPQDVGHECEVGSSNRASRCDHVHAHGYLSTSETHHHDADDIEGIPASVDLSDDTPLVESGTGSAGTSDEASRSDHVHPADGGGGGGGGDLSAAKQWLEDEGDARDYPASPGSIAEEFNSSTLTGSALGSPTAIDADTTVPGMLYIRRAASTGFSLQGRYWAWSPSDGDIVETRIHDARMQGAWDRYGLLVAEATPAATRGIYYEMTSSPVRRVSSISSTGLAAGAAFITQGPNTTQWIQPPLYFRIEYVNSTTLRFYFSYGGEIWFKLGADHTHALTIASVGLAVSCEQTATDAEAVFNYLREV